MYIARTGIISPLGRGLDETAQALRENRSAIAPLKIFALLHGAPLPVGQVPDLKSESPLPRTHQLAREAALIAMEGCPHPPDAVILGCTTGGILTTEHLLRESITDKKRYRYHGLSSVAEDIAGICGCTGPAIITSTACSSSAAAIALAVRLLRTGKMETILAGGVDSLSRLTYFGFHSLQLVDQRGCRPLDASRQGTTVAEGAAMLLLTSILPENPLAIILGAGLSCDAYHPAAPHPEGKGAFIAMKSALADAATGPSAVDYINLHGTGTVDNDLAEAKAIHALFPSPPPLSSIKGATGHSLAAAGAIEAVVAGLAVSHGFIPGNTGCRQPDPALGLNPVVNPVESPVRTVLSNSFGFGGNNASLVIGRSDTVSGATASLPNGPLAVHGSACLTGCGLKETTLAQLCTGAPVAGMLATDRLGGNLPPRLIRRLKRLARISLALASSACDDAQAEDKPSSVFMGTGWGALSETADFLGRLNESGEQFPSPTDFIGSVHNSSASQIAIFLGATGANITVSGGDYSFEQALLAANELLDADCGSALLLGADEGHNHLSPLLDPSIAPGSLLADGGGALLVNRDQRQARCLIRLLFYGRNAPPDAPEKLLEAWGGAKRSIDEYAAVFAGIPASMSESGERQVEAFLGSSDRRVPLWRYRNLLGEFASASAVAAVLAAAYLDAGRIPGAIIGDDDILLGSGSKILVLGTGDYLTAMEFHKP